VATAAVIQDMGGTLVNLLRLAAIPGVANADIFVATPDDFAPLSNRTTPFNASITVTLHRVTIAEACRNAPRRTLPDGRTTRQLLSLELHYLITPWAVRVIDEHLIAGFILQAMYDGAELGVADLVGPSWSSQDSVQLVLESLSLEDHYDIWATVDAPFRLALPYCARIIGIEPREIRSEAPVLEAFIGARQ
jgi:hypothetical protein